jgi:hypothetical protein
VDQRVPESRPGVPASLLGAGACRSFFVFDQREVRIELDAKIIVDPRTAKDVPELPES